MPAPTITIVVYERRLARPSQRWRWRAKGGNQRKLANAGEGYATQAGLVHNLHLLWPGPAGDHIVVQLPHRADPIALAALPDAA